MACIGAACDNLEPTEAVFAVRASRMHHKWVSLHALMLLTWLPWALCAPAVIRVGRQYPAGVPMAFRAWLSHLSLLLALAGVTSAWNVILHLLFDPTFPRTFWLLCPEVGPLTLLQSLFLYTVILGVDYAPLWRQRDARHALHEARVGEQAAEMALAAQRHKLQPHFIFNTLNSVSELIRQRRGATAIAIVVSLSEILRYRIAEGDRREIALSEELKLLRRYLDIQSVRFADRLELDTHITSALLDVRVPSLILQPIVEYAIEKIFAAQAASRHIRITARRVHERISISILIEVPNQSADRPTSPSTIDFLYVRERLHTLYGDAHECFERYFGTGLEIVLSLPCRA
jgi:hypothetical protein